MNYPDDETGQVLAEMHQAGIDLSQSHDVVFFHLFEKENQAQAMVEHIKEHLPEITCNLHPDQTPNVWDVDCTVVMTPTHEAILAQEEVFEKIVTQLSGYTDGWGIEA
ncbi:ribonuclease E inhibitor RraB [Colwellia sp. 75C3]|uniref:ribonuclease E inhibitor RraB n=1 Tax=Colwellia sp. 75C3 TaxID=888425 RepID=UPI000C33381E|nr:ribonuclease E inhibitor RraB [Colwellia sp. 75C3]PKG81557.1 ribonuclease E inhibitor RraB [Colwellia sp. 75C3]